MARFRLKNVIILILTLLNLFLLASLFMRKSAENQSRQLAREQLVALFAADNIQIDPALISYQSPPSGKYPEGCVFAPRCQYATEQCKACKPPLVDLGDDHKVRCFRYVEGGECNV